MASEDVIHDLSIPAFRVKMDVVPGHYNTLWFPDQAGRYPFLLLAILRHERTRLWAAGDGDEAVGYAAWLSGSTGANADPVVAGEKLFAEKACNTCHLADAKGRAPSLNGLFGRKVPAGRRFDPHRG